MNRLQEIKNSCELGIYPHYVTKDIGLLLTQLEKCREALEINKQEWEIIYTRETKPDGYKHLSAWQKARQVLRDIWGEE